MLAVIGLLIEPTSVPRVAIWTVVGLASILVHEMGHAVVALALGGRPNVQLMGLGGATDPGLVQRPGRFHSALLSLAGPGAGLVVGFGLLLFADPDLDALGTDRGLAAFTVATALWMNIGWSVLNLIPVLPLDGGRLLTEALPGDPITRSRRAYLVSAVVGGAVAVVLLGLNQPFAGVLFGVLASQAFSLWRNMRRQRDEQAAVTGLRDVHDRLAAGDIRAESELRLLIDDPQIGSTARTALIDHLARSGRIAEAEELSQELGTSTPTATFLVEVMRSGGTDGVDSLIEAYRRAPSRLATEHLVLGLHTAGRDDELATLVEFGARTANDLSLIPVAQLSAHQLEAWSTAAEIGAALYRLQPDAPGLGAFNVACSLARGGETEAALGWLGSALERGLPDPTMVETDPDLASLRSRPEFAELLRRYSRS